MLTFTCKATGPIQMLDAHARALLAVIGREPGKRGVITPEQIPQTITTLQNAIANERNVLVERVDEREAEDESERDAPVAINLSQRAFPLLEMLKRALAANEPVLWET